MATYEAEDARLRWLFAGRFSSTPSGQTMTLGRQNFAERMQAAGLSVTVEMTDVFSGQGARKVTLSFAKISDFSLLGVVLLAPPLAALSALLKDIASADPELRPSPDELIDRVRAAVGNGVLVDRLQGALVNPSTPNLRPQDAVSAIVSSVRGTGYKISTADAKKGRALIEDALYAAANEILRAPQVQALEGAWRGLRFVVDQIPKSHEIELVVIDLAVDERLPDAILAALPDDVGEQPDAIFIAGETAALPVVQKLALLGESFNIGVVFGCSATSLGTDTLRSEESCRWLSLVTNRFAVTAEGQHHCFSNPAFAVAAMLSASQVRSGTPARVFGPQAALSAPAVCFQPDGETTAPVEQLTVPEAKKIPGAAMLSGVRNTDRLVLAGFPTFKTDGISFPSQLITGRILRFSRWVRDQLSPTQTAEEIAQVYAEASRVFLFPGVDKGYHLSAQKQDTGDLLVSAWVSEPLCGMDLRFSFPLALSR